MNNPNLFTRSAYVFFNSLLKPKDIISFAKNNNFSNAFLVDKNIMYGTAEFYNLALKEKIKPIIGLEIDIDGLNKILIAKNYNGYLELIRISSSIQLKEKFSINLENIFEINISDFIPALYKEKSDLNALKDFYSITGKMFEKKSTHLLNREEFLLIYGKEKLDLIDKICNNVNLIIPKKENILPSFNIEGKKINSNEYLKLQLKEKLAILFNKNKKLNKNEYIERTKFELSVISKMGFENYFLIVSDIIKWAKNNGIFVGPGRGSAPGSLISYLLEITTIDPIENGLLFERFLNPKRVSMPDIDIDFEDSRRDEVIEYIAKKYGYNNTAQIITYQTLKAKMSFKDVARIKGLSASEANKITKLLPDDLTLQESFEKIKFFRKKIESTEMLKNIFNSAKLIEGLPRQFSTHAAGVVISDEKIINSIPVQKGYGKILQTQYSMDYMEYNGLLKIDILGLRNLSFIKETINNIKVNNNVDIDLSLINFNDSKVYSQLALGKTSGIFQLESPGMKNALKEIKVNCFEDIVATTSLFRPGPVKMIPEFSKRKNGLEKITYLNDKTKEILESTYGIIVYQEQIMKLVQVISNFSLAKADILRRAIGKKDLKLLESLKNDFFKGGIENGYEEKDINNIYNLIHEFSNYGFNRSHAFAYSTISYWLAWLKINYKLEFMNSLLNSVIGNASKTSEYISECEEIGIVVKKPSIFKSKSNFKILNNEIIIGLRTIKGVGESLIKNIKFVQEKINDNTSLIDLFIEFDKQGITINSLEILIKSGSFEKYGINVESILKFIPKIEEYLKMIKVKNNDLYEYKKNLVPEPKIELINSNKDNDYFIEVMGFSLSNNELKNNINNIKKKININIDSLLNLKQDQNVVFVGEIISVKEIKTKTGKKMAFASINDGERKISCTFWPATYEKFNLILKSTTKAIFYGKADLKRQENVIINKMEEIK